MPLETVLAIAVLILGVVVAGGFLLITRMLRQFDGGKLSLRETPVGRSATAPTRPDLAGGEVREAVVAARTDAAAAKAEANAAGLDGFSTRPVRRPTASSNVRIARPTTMPSRSGRLPAGPPSGRSSR